MWPWGHLAIGYLCYRGWCGARGTSSSRGDALFVLAVSTQLPDLIDKPLAWELSFLATGRSLAHSLVIGLPILLLLWWLLADNRQYWVAFAIGYLTHLVGDGIHALIAGDYASLAYLGWPFVRIPEADVQSGVGIVEFLLTPEVTTGYLVQWGLFVVAAGLWAADGFPGLERLRPPGSRSVAKD